MGDADSRQAISRCSGRSEAGKFKPVIDKRYAPEQIEHVKEATRREASRRCQFTHSARGSNCEAISRNGSRAASLIRTEGIEIRIGDRQFAELEFLRQ
jgi:hypothetical protein